MVISGERSRRFLKRAVLVLPIVLVLAGCNVWSMYGDGTTHLSTDSSSVITTSDASTLAEAGTTSAATGSGSWITSSPTIASNGMLYTTANYAASGDVPASSNRMISHSRTHRPTIRRLRLLPMSVLTRLVSCTHTPRREAPPTARLPPRAIRPSNCQPVWTATPTQTNGLTGAPTVDTSLSTPVVYVGSHDGELYAYNASTGALMWHSQSLGGSIDGSLTIANGYIYVPEDYGWVYVFPSTTGTDGEDDNVGRPRVSSNAIPIGATAPVGTTSRRRRSPTG